MAIKIRVDAKKMEDLLRNFYLITGIRIVNIVEVLKKFLDVNEKIAIISSNIPHASGHILAERFCVIGTLRSNFLLHKKAPLPRCST